MSEPEATVSSRRRIPGIWLVPIVAVVLGIWMVIYTAMTEGPEITIVFSTAEGIEAGKTKIRARSVQVGIVEEVTLNEDLESVTVVAKLERVATPLLRDDTRLWVVRPRIGAGGISGLGTILSGAYIELEPGTSAPSDRREFKGLDDLPMTPVDAPGLSLVLVSDQAGSVSSGDPILYHGFQVGRVEDSTFDPQSQEIRHTVFIEKPYDSLVDQASRFWNASGISLAASAEGVRLDLGSLQSLLSGGVAFDVPEGQSPAGPVQAGAEFVLYDRYESTLKQKFDHAAEFVVSFSQSVRGLLPGAPVEYRGMHVGFVRRILVHELWENARGEGEASIPVLIAIEPARVGRPDTAEAAESLKVNLAQNVRDGLRASLQSGNLLTGRLFIALDSYPDAEPAEMGSYAGYPTLPSQAGGLARIERQVSTLLAKLNDLPIDVALNQLNGTLREVRRLVASGDFEELPGPLTAALNEAQTALASLSPDSPLYDRLDRTVLELKRTLQSLNKLARSLEEQPNSLIFSKPVRPDPVPGGGQ